MLFRGKVGFCATFSSILRQALTSIAACSILNLRSTIRAKEYRCKGFVILLFGFVTHFLCGTCSLLSHFILSPVHFDWRAVSVISLNFYRKRCFLIVSEVCKLFAVGS